MGTLRVWKPQAWHFVVVSSLYANNPVISVQVLSALCSTCVEINGKPVSRIKLSLSKRGSSKMLPIAVTCSDLRVEQYLAHSI